MRRYSPSIAECLALMDEYEMLANIRRHSFVVARVADRLHSNLQDTVNDPLPEKEVVIAGALLHDIAKTGCLKKGCDHARVGGEICVAHGFPEIAEIVKEHVILNHFSQDRYRRGIFLAKEIIYYADKRVLHDRIVTLPRRLEYILERYGNNDTSRHLLIRKNFQQCQDLESWICKKAGCTAEQLLEDIDTRPYQRDQE